MQTEFKIGDIVQAVYKPEFFGIVYCFGSYYDIYLNKEAITEHVVWFRNVEDISTYRKIQPTKELLKKARQQVEWVYKQKYVDNLTYIELLARLNEYTKQRI